jgi:integrase
MTTEIKSLMRKKNGIDYKSYTIRDNRDRVFYPAEWKTTIDCLKDYQKLNFETLMIAGTRVNELRNVKVEDNDFPNQRMIIRVTKGRTNKETNNKKSKTRTIRISSELCKKLKKHIAENNLQPTDYLFQLSTSALNQALKKALQKANIKDWQMFSIHNIRKTAETWALAIDIDSLKLSKRFGHNMITMYEHYSQSDVYTYKEKDEIKEILGDTYSNLN